MKNALLHNKKGAVFPVRTAGRKQKGGVFWMFVILAVGTMVVLASIGVYNGYVEPFMAKHKMASSLESGSGTNQIEGSQTQYLDRPNAATFTFQVLDNANDDSTITAGIPVGALSTSTDADGNTVSKEWLNTGSDKTNATISNIPEDTVLSFYGGDGTYYLVPTTNRKITVGDKVTLNGATIQTEANMVITVYDDTGSTALSAATNTTYNDYKATLGSGQEETIYIKVSNNAADKRFNIKAICTGVEGTNVSSIEITGSDWSKSILPTVVETAQVTTTLDDATTTTAKYATCYVYKAGTNEVISLDEWEDSPLIKAKINAITAKNPAADVVFFTVMDGAWARGSDGKGYFDFYQHVDSEANVGLTETLSSPLGKQLGAIVELD